MEFKYFTAHILEIDVSMMKICTMKNTNFTIFGWQSAYHENFPTVFPIK